MRFATLLLVIAVTPILAGGLPYALGAERYLVVALGVGMLLVGGVALRFTSASIGARRRSRTPPAGRVLGVSEVAPSWQGALAVDALASFPAQVAILDSHGSICVVNDAWNTFARSNGVDDPASVGPGINYLDVCARAARADAPCAAAAHEGVEAVCAGRRADFELEYRSDGPVESNWFQMKVTALRGEHGGAVVSHHDITGLKRDDRASRDRQFSALMDALPIGVKIVDARGRVRHVNAMWRRTTGRSVDDELKRPWTDRIHPDDRLNCERAFQRAVESQQPLTLEYRVQRPDGGCGWLLDHVVPRHDDAGHFTDLLTACLDITDRRLYEEKLRVLTARLITAQEDERHRIARELHDDVNQRVALLAIGIDHTCATSLDAGIRDTLRDLWLQATGISKALHRLSHELHSSTLDALGLVPAIRTLGRELSTKGLRVDLFAEGDCSDLSPDAALGLFRVVQEALSNVLKHSGAGEAVVKVRQSKHVVVACVEDHGRGFDAAIDVGGLGLHSMRERLTPTGGEVRIHSRPGKGTTVEARVPKTTRAVAVPTHAA